MGSYSKNFSERRLRRQGWLLLGVWVLLAAALGQWVYASYRAVKGQLDEGVVSMWQGAQLQAVDAYRVATKVINLGLGDSVVLHDIQLSDSLGSPAATVKSSSGKSSNIQVSATVVKVSPGVHGDITVQEDTTKSVRAIVQQSNGVNAIFIDGGDSQASSTKVLVSEIDPRVAHSIDTAKLREEFTQQMAGKGLDVRWSVEDVAALADSSAQLWVDAGDDSYLIARVEGQRGVVAWQMLPLVLGVFVALVLAGVALLAFYRSQRQLFTVGVFQRDFARNMAHEMRTPLATLRLLLESLRHGEASRYEGKKEESLALAEQETDRLITLTERLSAAVRSGEANLPLAVERIDLMELLRTCVALFESARVQVDAEIVLPSVDNGVLFVEMDGVYLRSVVDNLIDNALKYGGKGVRLTISVEQGAAGMSIAFSDNGKGVAPEHAKHLFDRFYRVPTGNRLPVRGLGVGLYFCREAMRAHGGDITLVSEVGKGCCFTLLIPSHCGEGDHSLR